MDKNKKYVIMLVFLVIISLHSEYVGSQDCPRSDEIQNKERLLIDKLMCNYDPENRPVKNESHSVLVSFDIHPLHINAGDVRDGSDVTINSWITLVWRDEYLVWSNKTEFTEVQDIQISSEKIWVPNIVLFNSYVSHPDSQHEFITDCKVESNGAVVCVPHASHDAVCDTQLTHWPYDTQNCTLVFKAWLNNAELINLTSDALYMPGSIQVDMDFYDENLYWEVIEVQMRREVEGFSFFSFVSINYSFILKRHTAMYGAIIIGPGIAMILMTSLSIVLDVDSTDRTYLLGVSILSHIIYIQQLSWMVPYNGDSCPYVILFFRDSILVTIFVLITTSVLKNRRVWSAKWMDKITGILYTTPGKIIMFKGLKQSDLNAIVSESTVDVNRETIPEVEQTTRMKSEIIKTFVNRILFILIALTYLMLSMILLTNLN